MVSTGIAKTTKTYPPTAYIEIIIKLMKEVNSLEK